MSGNSVVVHDVDMLEGFGEFLQSKRDELETLFDTLNTETVQQETNWQDPQYEYLKDQVENYCAACKTQLDELDDSIRYINALVTKLKNL